MTTAIVLTLCGCSRTSAPTANATWFGDREDGFPKWTIASEIPSTLHKDHQTLPDSESLNGQPLCYVRAVAWVIPPDCYDAAQGDAAYFVERFREAETATHSNRKLRESLQCGHIGHEINNLETIVLRLRENGAAVFSSEQADDAENGKGYMIAMKPLKIDDDGCTVTYVMQGVDDWTPAERARAWWTAGKELRLESGQWHAEWATMKTGDHHVLSIVSLTRMTKGELWATPCGDPPFNQSPVRVSPHEESFIPQDRYKQLPWKTTNTHKPVG